jgi:hypothetical protein
MSILAFITLINTEGKAYSSFVQYEASTNKIYPVSSLKSYDKIAELLQRSGIVNFNEIPNAQDSFGNVILMFIDHNGNQWYAVVQYDKVNNRIYPPHSFVPFSEIAVGRFVSAQVYSPPTPPIVICLKGHIHEYGPSLEKVPNMVYIGRNLNMGGWKLPKSKWGNPFTVKEYGRDEALRQYREYILATPQLFNSLSKLGGKILACWCHPEPCHGDILVDLYKQYVK